MRNVTTVVLSKDPVLVDPSNGTSPHDAVDAKPDNLDDIVDSMFTYTCDVSNYKEVEEVAERIRKDVSLPLSSFFNANDQIGDPTIIINNAGVVKGKLLLDLTESDIRE
jgi:all-trans-retinol dehydrogenase (NAD+)